MARKKPTIETLKALLARSGNQCAFPGCYHPLINDSNKLIANLCHIEAANRGGERYNPNQDDNQRAAYDNLLFLCYRHHIETNDEEQFTVEILRKMKVDHEAKFKESSFRIEEELMLKQIQKDITKFWNETKDIYETENDSPPDLKMEINFDSGINELIEDLRQNIHQMYLIIRHLHESEDALDADFNSIVASVDLFGVFYKRVKKIPSHRNPFINRNWEMLNLSVPNISQKIEILLNQIEIGITEDQVLRDPQNEQARARLEHLKAQLKTQARNAGYYD